MAPGLAQRFANGDRLAHAFFARALFGGAAEVLSVCPRRSPCVVLRTPRNPYARSICANAPLMFSFGSASRHALAARVAGKHATEAEAVGHDIRETPTAIQDQSRQTLELLRALIGLCLRIVRKRGRPRPSST